MEGVFFRLRNNIFFLSLLVILLSTVVIFSLPGGVRKGEVKKEKFEVRGENFGYLATAYGSQRHVFANTKKEINKKTSFLITEEEKVGGVQDVFEGSLMAVWVRDNQIMVSYSNDYGQNWQDLSSPLINERVEVVSGAQDEKGNLHLVYESEGNIFYRKVSEMRENGLVKPGGWVISSPVPLDLSGLAHRPSLVLDYSSDLPLVSWSFESKKAGVRLSKINFLRAKGDPVFLENWCNAKGDSCGKPVGVSSLGSADSLGEIISSGLLHPVLRQMPQSQDLYLWWSEEREKRGGLLKMAVAKNEIDHWVWGEISVEDNLDSETSKNFSLSAAANFSKGEIAVVYVQEGMATKVVVYKKEGIKEDISPGKNLGGQFSLSAYDGKYFLFYRRPDGKISGRLFDQSWSEELLESPGEGGHPSAPDDPADGKIVIAYTEPSGTISFLNYSLIAQPELTPTAFPTEIQD